MTLSSFSIPDLLVRTAKRVSRSGLFSDSCDSVEPPELPSLYHVARTGDLPEVAHKIRLTETGTYVYYTSGFARKLVSSHQIATRALDAVAITCACNGLSGQSLYSVKRIL
jgi:hypothetical protein